VLIVLITQRYVFITAAAIISLISAALGIVLFQTGRTRVRRTPIKFKIANLKQVALASTAMISEA
jgi:hypothetical protein